MNERNPLQELVDRDLSTLQWTDRRKQRVLRAMDEERRPIPMKKRLTGAAALAMVVCLMAVTALAATLIYSNRYNETARADALLAEQYGITADKLSFFTRTAEGDVYTYTGLADFSGMLGDYRVNTATGQVEWLIAFPQASGWNADKLDEVLLICQTPDGYETVTAEAKAAAQALGMALPSPTPPTRAEMDAAVAASQAKMDQAASLARITMTEAAELARAALREQYGLTDEQLAKLELVDESSYFCMEGDIPAAEPYFWLQQQEGVFTEKDGIYIVVVNAVDGAIEEIVYDSGLLGNG